MIHRVWPRTDRPPRYKARIAIANTDRAVLEDIQRWYGGLLYSQPPRKPNWSHGLVLVWTDPMVEGVLLRVIEHFRLKRRQALVLSRFLRHRAVRRNSAGHDLSHQDWQAPLTQRLYERMKRLNARGPPTVEHVMNHDRSPRSRVARKEMIHALPPTRRTGALGDCNHP